MAAHAMTSIREEEIEGTMPTNVGTPSHEGNASVNIIMKENTSTPIGGEEVVKTSGSATTIVPGHEEGKQDNDQELDSGMVVIGYFFEVPSVKWHPALEMMSKAGLTQGQYERKVLAQRYVYLFLYCLSATTSLNYTSSQLHVELATPTRRALPFFHCSVTLHSPHGIYCL